MAQNRWRDLNISVLNKMPRDCTAPADRFPRMDSPRVVAGIPFTTKGNLTHAMAGNNANNRNRAGNAASGSKKKKKNGSRGGSGGRGAPAAVGAGYISQGPAVVRSVGPTVRFSNTEFVADVNAPSTTSTSPVIALAINPANQGFCSWLSRIAIGYELYRFRKLILRYTPSCGSSTPGMIVMAVDFDASDAPPTSKQSISAFEGSVRGNVWSKASMRVDPTAGWYYVGQPGGISNPVGTDVKMYDMGKVYLGVYNHNASGSMGELSIDYDIEFAKPDYSVPQGLSEFISPVASTVPALAGTSVGISGNSVFSLASAGTAAANLTASVAGDFMLYIMGPFTASSTLTSGNPFLNCQQTDPNSYVTQNIPWTEWSTTTTAANTAGYYTNLLLLSVIPGSVISLALLPVITAAGILKIRVASYRKALA